MEQERHGKKKDAQTKLERIDSLLFGLNMGSFIEYGSRSRPFPRFVKEVVLGPQLKLEGINNSFKGLAKKIPEYYST